MKKILVLMFIVIGGYYLYTHHGVQEKITEIFEPQITISDLKSHPSLFVDSLVKLRNIRIIETKSVLNLSMSKIGVQSGQTIIMLSNHPYRINETIAEIKGRYLVAFQNQDRCYEVFILDDLKPFKKLIKVINQSLLFQ